MTWWHGGVVAWWRGGMVTWWHGDVVACWRGGMVAWWMVVRWVFECVRWLGDWWFKALVGGLERWLVG